MRRVVVLGGLGLFGRAAADQLRQLGIVVRLASRGNGAEIRIDANDPASIRAALRKGDLIIDAAGPFQSRTLALVEAAAEIGFDLIDLNDSLSYSQRVLALEAGIAAAGIRVLSAASTVSAVAAAVVRQSGVDEPVRVMAFLAPATRYTANAGAGRSLVETVGRPVQVWRGGRLQTAVGWSESRRFPMSAPVGAIRGRLFESADAVHLPRAWPTLRDVAMFVDTNTPGLNRALSIAGAVPAVRELIAGQMRLGTWIARQFGATAGGVGYEIEDAGGRMRRYAIAAQGTGHLVAIAPVVLAARAIVEDRFAHQGLVPPERHVEPAELFAFQNANGIRFSELEPC